MAFVFLRKLVRPRGTRTPDLLVRAVLSDGKKLQVDYGNEETALIRCLAFPVFTLAD
jgi:hypothetical protein